MGADRLDADCVIVGAGGAGLSLAVHLLDQGPDDLRVALLEPRTEYHRDRTWCFWDVEPHPFRSCVTHRWARWQVRAAGRGYTARSDRYPYCHLPSDAFYREALRRIDASPRMELRTGVRVEGIAEGAGGVTVESSEGPVRASMAFDSRPPRLDHPPAAGEVRLLQHFGGWMVRADRALFDPSTCTLMDFDVDQGDGVHFVYVLPFDPHTALVEDTWFTEAPWPRARYDRELARYLTDRFGAAAYEVTHTEGGVLPMTTEPFVSTPGSRVLRIGLGGGMAKASTGYAFSFIQRHSSALARRIGRGRLPDPVEVRSGWTRMLDRVFLKVLAERPAEAPDLFLRLFEGAPDDVVVRFLCERSSLQDDLRIMASLPAGPFAGAAWRARRLWLRRA
ncbi:MAG: lycopene cyclase family protein [Myxococcota bacterium]